MEEHPILTAQEVSAHVEAGEMNQSIDDAIKAMPRYTTPLLLEPAATPLATHPQQEKPNV